MNFRILATSVWPRGRVFALLAATALSASLLAPEVQAQQPPAAAPAPAAAPKAKPKAAPKAAPAAPAPTAQAVDLGVRSPAEHASLMVGALVLL